MSDTVLQLDGVSVRIETDAGILEAVDDVSLTVNRGELVGIVGESGSGKSTLLKAIAGVLPRRAHISAGTVTVSHADRDAEAPGVSMVFQEPLSALDPVMRVGEQIAEAPRVLLGLSRQEARNRALDLMREVGIPDAERRYRAYPQQLSGGMRQRVLIAAALSSEPALLLCDEPTTALDVTVQAQILRLLRRTCERRKLGVLYVTHDLAVVSQLCRRLAVMYAGRLVETGGVREVFTETLHPYTRALMQSLPAARKSGERLVSIPGAPPNLVNPPTGCRFHPRCQWARPDCAEGPVPLRDLADRHSTACRYAEEIFTK